MKHYISRGIAEYAKYTPLVYSVYWLGLTLGLGYMYTQYTG